VGTSIFEFDQPMEMKPTDRLRLDVRG
jgi:hypothetical protein